ncbi:hypothetical protein RYX45_00595 [Alkalihalophilus pseudofirmus]|uniref:Transcriptional regulator n=1 Tax=Alkalihalophilus pseudofirmus TaxID=79885 RepID=A0AAJ2KTP0_ALKPS|nr:hypothetical protein [Alkalihalophilus pseudofirmus]MDV2883658.1 hypothetical protein [Alkalihalophilus pseudofirmus]
MTVKIGFIGSEHSSIKAREISETLPETSLNIYPYQTPDEIKLLHRKAIEETDVICFSGIVPFHFRDKLIRTDKQVVIAPFHEYMVAASLLHCVLKYSCKVEQLSIDLPDRNVLHSVAEDIKLSFNDDQVYDYKWIYSDEEDLELSFLQIADFHIHLFKSGKTKMAITSLHYVHDLLKEAAVPVIYMIDTEQTLKTTLKDAAKQVQFSRLKDGMPAVISLSFPDSKITSHMQSVLSSFFETLTTKHQTSSLTRHETATFYSTAGMVKEHLLMVRDSSWIKFLEDKLTTPFQIGIGYGRHLYEAEEHAKQAMQIAKQETSPTESNGYLLTEDKKLKGPIRGVVKEKPVRVTDKWLHGLMKKTNITLNTFNRFFHFIRVHQYQPFTVNDYASYSKVSTRTSERFIKRLYESHIIEIRGLEQNSQSGRPRKVYILKEEIEKQIRTATEV